MYKRIFLAALLASLVSLFPAGARACAIPGSYPDQPWTTHIQSITPQAAIAGINQLVYVQGYCFGDSMGTVTLNGVAVPETDIKFWTDHEIKFALPSNATTGSLAVTSQNYGNDSSKKEAVCCGDGCSDNENWPVGTQVCGNDSIGRPS